MAEVARFTGESYAMMELVGDSMLHRVGDGSHGLLATESVRLGCPAPNSGAGPIRPIPMERDFL